MIKVLTAYALLSFFIVSSQWTFHDAVITGEEAAVETEEAEEVSLEIVAACGTDDAETIVTEKNVSSAKLISQTDSIGNKEYYIQLEFDEEGTKAFALATQEHMGEELSIVCNGEVIMSPVIREVITEGKVVISGNFTQEEAEDLADKLSSCNGV